jgi:hypothetical protein
VVALAIVAAIAAFIAIFGFMQANEKTQEAQQERNRAQSMLTKNYWSQAISAKKTNDWLKASHFFARSAKEEKDLLQIKNCIFNIQNSNKNLFLAAQIKHNKIEKAILSKDENLILTWGGKTVRLWYTRNGTPATLPMIHEGRINGATFNRDESLILTWSDDGTARLWHTKDGTPATSPIKHDDKINGAIFSNDGILVLTWSDGGTVRLWYTKDGTPATSPMKHDDEVEGAVLFKILDAVVHEPNIGEVEAFFQVFATFDVALPRFDTGHLVTTSSQFDGDTAFHAAEINDRDLLWRFAFKDEIK